MIGIDHSFIPKKIDRAFKKQAWYTSVAYTTYFLFGIMRGYPAFLKEQLARPEAAVYLASEDEASWIASLSIFPNPVGSIFAGVLMDKFGRKISLQLSMLIFTLGWALIACSNHKWILYVGTVIVGLAIGVGACSTIYVAEICEIRNRCMMLSFLEIYFSLGILVSYVSTCYLKWKVAAMIFTIFSGISLFLLCYIPESPYWLMKDNRKSDALKSYNELRGRDENHPFDAEFSGIDASIESENQGKSYTIRIEHIKAFFILVTFHLLLQGCGYTIILSYVKEIIPVLKAPVSKDIIAIGYSFCSFLSSFATPLTANYYRRREATIISGIGMTISLSILIFHNIYANFIDFEYFWVLVPIGLYLFMFCCTIGILTLSQAMISELFPTDVRGMMCGITEAVGTVLSGLSVKLFPIAKEYMNQTSILTTFAVFGLLTALFGKFILPETYGKSLNEIQEQYFRKNKKNKKSAQIERQI